MESFNKQKWEELNLSGDELKRLGQALKQEEFRNLLLEYVKEINDPENRKQYEREITHLENERGVDIKFVHPSPGYVIKTSVDGKRKAFINICSNTNLSKPSSSPDVQSGHRGFHWSLPYCLAPPREDVDKKKNSCTVYDVVFHPDTLSMTKNNASFKKLVDDTALGAVEENFNVSLDKVNIKFPKIQFKGARHPTVIRKNIDNFQPTDVTDIPNYPYPPIKEDTQLECDSSQKQPKISLSNTLATKDETKYTVPKYTIRYRNNVDLQDYTNDPMSKMSITVPNALLIEIDLPLLKSSADASIDVTENTLYLFSEKPVKYKLNLNLPYIVDSNQGSAKFDSLKKKLNVTLPVVKQKIKLTVHDTAREDSGVESDNCYGRSNSMSSSDEDGTENESIGLVNKPDSVKYVSGKCGQICSQTFLKSNIHYVMPNFSCELLKDLNPMLNFTLQVPNVNPESVEYCFLNNSSGFYLSFQSIGTGFFPVNYGMCIVIPPQGQIENESLSVEVWDNNVIVQIKMVSSDMCLSEYYVGCDESNLQKYMLPVTHLVDCEPNIKQKIESKAQFEEIKGNINVTPEESNLEYDRNYFNNAAELSVSTNMSGSRQDELLSGNSHHAEPSMDEKSKTELSSDEMRSDVCDQNEEDELLEEVGHLSVSGSTTSSFDDGSASPPRQAAKSRTMSESNQGSMRRKIRGILKIGRSLSESSVDDYASWSAEKNEKTKKSVRFSEVISKQTFRMNSSILGQRKKNQRKMRNKKRAQERRVSESGGESEGEIEGSVLKIKESGNLNEIDVWLVDPDSSSCDVSEVSEVSDTSESDDGQKGESMPSTPCSSKRNHKRRGKKSARKSAATAKLHFMEN